ncbi:MAG: phosphotransferase, partial [Prevotella sp.]|nr:phosphotransferase [Prevotella sp.]
MEKKEINNDLLRLFRAWHGSDAAVVERLAGAGSNRMYVRLTADSSQTVVGVEGTCVEENAAFVYLSRHFAGHGLPVPQVLAVSDDGLCYLQQDLGSTSLFDAIAEGRRAGGRYNERERQLLLKTIRLLPQFQVKGAQGLDFARCYRQSVMDVRSVMFDLNYFKYCFLLPSGIAFDEVRLEEDFGRLAQSLVQDVGDFFLYRDFQARNVMLVDNDQPYFIDFQGGRRGSFYYDVASFVWQASACYPDELRRQLVDAYYDELKALTEVPPRQVFDERLLLFVFFRTLQVLGAYGFRGWFERKAHFINS